MELKVVAIGEHINQNVKMLALQNPATTQVFLIGIKGVKKVG